jgi:hypothetical protein
MESEMRAHTWLLVIITLMATVTAGSTLTVAYFVLKAALAINELGQSLSEIPGLSG